MRFCSLSVTIEISQTCHLYQIICVCECVLCVCALCVCYFDIVCDIVCVYVCYLFGMIGTQHRRGDVQKLKREYGLVTERIHDMSQCAWVGGCSGPVSV